VVLEDSAADGVGAVYGVRHEMIATALVRAFADHLEVIPSAGGLHVATVLREF